MKRRLLSLLSLSLALLMLLSILASCNGGSDNETEGSSQNSDSINNESDTEKETEKETDNGGDSEDIEGPVANRHQELIETSNALANGVQAFFTNANRTHYSLQNLEMTMNYCRSSVSDQLVESIKNTQGNTYIQNTMDAFVRMKDGGTFYASQSTTNAEANLYRFGYYYYQALFEFQNFVPKNYETEGGTTIHLKNQFSKTDGISRGKEGDALTYMITDADDPKIFYDKGISLDTENHNVLILKVKAYGSTSSIQIFPKLDNGTNYNAIMSTTLSLHNDGEFHTYYIPFFNFTGYEGNLTGIRLDPGGDTNGGIAIESMTLAKAMVEDSPTALSINRHFHVYSDKMHHAIQYAVTERTENIAEIGMLTEIDETTVNKLLVIDDDGKTYDSLAAVSNWKSVVAIAFDIKDAGIFGFILPKDDAAGNIFVEQKDGKYVIEQTRVPTLADGTEGVIIPSIDTEKKDSNGNYVHAQGVINNGNDVYLAQRFYTDENHDFAEFIKETGFERDPLDAKRVNVSGESDNAAFAGYDPIRGIYVFKIATPSGGFYTPYNNPNKDYKVNFSIRSDVDRSFYAMTSGSAGLLECATLMDDKMMLLPIPIEVIKNFSEATGERNLYNISDPTFSEAIFHLPVKANQKVEYTITNLYQNWGNFPLKQISQIPFHCPYYHLSTGVTETNCILPWFGTSTTAKGSGQTLPDFRSMSAPYWQSQPQHNSCGAHMWLTYTDTEGKVNLVENYKDTIPSYGPTYAEVIMENLSDDGKIKVTYTHMEMPQVDENRTYYTMEYEFLEDLTINNFKDSFQFYKVTDNDKTGTYKKVGYLNEQNECVVIDSNQDKNLTPEYILGDECPYFSFFMMPDWSRESGSAEGYANLAFLVYNSEFIIGGTEKDYNFLIKNQKDYVTLTLNEAGTVEFKKGDKITINAILLPWGSQELEDDPANRLNKSHATGYTEYTYSTVLEDGSLYMDKNVRDVRANTLLDPLKVTSETDKILESPFLPRVRSKDGKTATFTLSGGENNCAVHVYGFNKLTAPKVEELVNGEWVEYVLSSKDTPDKQGRYHYYDGYAVYYDKDGRYSYSFVVDMSGDAERTFRISAADDFAGWPREQLPPENENFLNLYYDPEELHELFGGVAHMFGTSQLGNEEDGMAYVSSYFLTTGGYTEAYITPYRTQENDFVTGQYLVVKYRVPKTNKEDVGRFEIFAGTTVLEPTESGSTYHTPIADGEWHVDVIDLSKAKFSKIPYSANADGNYCAQFVRFDVFNSKLTDPDTHIDIAYIGLDSDLKKICQLESENFDTINLNENGKISVIDTETGEAFVKTYIDPSSGYHESDVIFGSTLDFVNGTKYDVTSTTKKDGIVSVNGVVVNNQGKLVVNGWCAANGGIEKYVWSIDGGKTWNDCGGTPTDAHDGILNAAEKYAVGEEYDFDDREASKANGNFQTGGGGGVNIDLSEVSGKVDVIFAAIPKADTSSLILLYCFERVDCTIVSVLDPDSIYLEYDLNFGSHIDSYNGNAKIVTSGSATGLPTFEGYTIGSDGKFVLNGWCVVDGGVNKYVWTADNGKTWHDCTGKTYAGNEAMLASAKNKADGGFSDSSASLKNAGFQDKSNGLLCDLSEYVGTTDTVTILLAAVPEMAPNRVVMLYKFVITLPTVAE